MGYASDRRDRKRAKRRENLGLALGALGGIVRGLQTERHHRDVLAVQQAKLALDESTEKAKLGMEREKIDVSKERANTYLRRVTGQNAADMERAKGTGAKGPTAAMERDAMIRSSGSDLGPDASLAQVMAAQLKGGNEKANATKEWLRRTHPDRAKALGLFDEPVASPKEQDDSWFGKFQQGLQQVIQAARQGGGAQQQAAPMGPPMSSAPKAYDMEAEMKKIRDSVVGQQPQGLSVFGQTPPGAVNRQMQGDMNAPPQQNFAPGDEEGQQMDSLSQAYMTAINGRPGDPAAMQAWAQIGQVFPQLVPAWVKAQAMGGFMVPPAAQAQPDQKAQQLEQAGRAMWKMPQ